HSIPSTAAVPSRQSTSAGYRDAARGNIRRRSERHAPSRGDVYRLQSGAVFSTDANSLWLVARQQLVDTGKNMPERRQFPASRIARQAVTMARARTRQTSLWTKLQLQSRLQRPASHVALGIRLSN